MEKQQDRHFSEQSVFAFLSALSIALKVADRKALLGERRDLFRLVEAEIRLFFQVLPGHENLTKEQWNDLDRIRNILKSMYVCAEIVMLDPDGDTTH